MVHLKAKTQTELKQILDKKALTDSIFATILVTY
jgi:hypothetical protein